MIIGRFRGRESSFLSSRLFAKVTTCRGRFANHSPLILQKSFLPTNILIYAAEPFIFSTFAWFFTSERPGSSNRLTRVVQSADPGRPIERPGLFVRPTGVVHLQEDTSEGRNKYVERTKTY